MLYHFLDYFFFVFHSVVILFNTLGWLFRKTRIWNLIGLSVTAFSWFVLGAFYGWGYCFCTDWHWRVREKLGYTDMPDSYMVFLIQKLTGHRFNVWLVDAITLIVFVLSLIMSLILTIRDRKRKKRNKISA